MKITSITLLLSALFLLSCVDIPISPVKNNNHSYPLIKLSPKEGVSIETDFSVTKTIDGDKGGMLKIKESYVGEEGQVVKIDVKLKIRKHSYSGDVDITMTVNAVYATIKFTPHMVFNTPVELKASFKGIDLGELYITKGGYDFVFIDDNGNIEMVEHDGVDVKEWKGEIKLHKNAYLNHFSRYAFTR